MYKDARVFFVVLMIIFIGINFVKIGSFTGALGHSLGALIIPAIIGFALLGSLLFVYNLVNPSQAKKFNPYTAVNIGLVLYLGSMIFR